MVLALELTGEEVLERLQKMLKGVSVVPHTVPEYCANNPPPAVSFFYASTFCISFAVSTFCLIFLVWLFYSFI